MRYMNPALAEADTGEGGTCHHVVARLHIISREYGPAQILASRLDPDFQLDTINHINCYGVNTLFQPVFDPICLWGGWEHFRTS
jgi:hypothetical protein